MFSGGGWVEGRATRGCGTRRTGWGLRFEILACRAGRYKNRRNGGRFVADSQDWKSSSPQVRRASPAMLARMKSLSGSSRWAFANSLRARARSPRSR